MTIPTYRIPDMDCPEEAASIARALEPLLGGPDRLSFDTLRREARVDLTGLPVSPDQVARAMAGTGLRIVPVASAGFWEPDADTVDLTGSARPRPALVSLTTSRPETGSRADGEQGGPARGLPSCACCGGACSTGTGFWARRGREALCLASGIFWIAGLTLATLAQGDLWAVFRESGDAPLSAKALWLAAVACGVWHVLPRAWRSLVTLRPDMNLLMTVAVAGAVAVGEHSEAASVAFLFALANQLEAWSVGRARDALQALLALAPETALVIVPPNPLPVETPVGQVAPGSRVLVRPGDRIPLDGVVRAGASAVDQSPVTGESIPVAKGPGDPVFAGSVNTEGALEVETTRPAAQSTLARILRMVEEARSRRARSVQWVERFAAVYTPVMMGVAALFAVVPPLFLGGEWGRWFYEGLVILVISCPCALVISTPVSMVTALASAARNGVLVKGGAFLEIPATLDAVALDKTGTLTLGRPAVTEARPFEGVSERELLAVAAGLEARSSHPVARAVLEHAASRGVAPVAAQDVRSRPGLGVRGVIDATQWTLGNARFLAESGDAPESPELARALAQAEASAGTVVFAWSREKVLGCLSVEDQARPQAADAVRRLLAEGVAQVVMLTGDNPRAAARIAAQAGVTDFRAELLPEDKARAVAELAASGRRVAMVGDGVNDAPALAAAHLGVAMGAAGSDAAIETADVALMSDDLSKLPWLVRHSRRALGTVKANIAVALGVKAVFLALAGLQMATLWTAILADLGTSLFVIFNGLRLLRIRP
ncbi:putative cadmium-transporting ATPase [Fundidesulfovibrio magnetotacticus]|uniref:P-type Zn(2+) transporter n=1 Tax=Fundidesulfovibrio magnetotacticus TaxID=2730080 RepID=A0A6V8LXC7_9BACT|nr:heavy metal translocating P-type ATPase [Fundidesulfovibrio magnetotacticus]GFK92935.1 putative cadmium-transporting ATPase [Fundidesulfovibrio magnetotacticus]